MPDSTELEVIEQAPLSAVEEKRRLQHHGSRVMTGPDRQLLFKCERTIERGLALFIEVGKALVTIRDQRLYMEGYGTFDEYCRERWGFKRSRAHQFIKAAETNGRVHHGGQELPNLPNERVAREVARVPEDQQAEVWQQAVEKHGDEPTAKQVRDVAKEDAATQLAADAVGVSPEDVEKATRILDSGNREVIKAVEDGHLELDDALAKLAPGHTKKARILPSLMNDLQCLIESHMFGKKAPKWLQKEIGGKLFEYVKVPLEDPSREKFRQHLVNINKTVKRPSAGVRGPLECRRPRATWLLYDGVETISSKG